MMQYKRLIPLVAALASSMILAGGASPAVAAPQGIFSMFADCPTGAPGVTLCISGQITGGEVSIGELRIPIDKTITLQSGAIEKVNALNQYYLIPGKDGNSISSTELGVPGGLPSLLQCDEARGHGFFAPVERAACRAISRHHAAEVTVTAEPVATASNPATIDVARLLAQVETAMTMPIRIHVKNVLLGKSCYIGSATDPIELHLTTGTTSPPLPNQPIKGTIGKVVGGEEHGYELLGLEGASLVDNSFSVPIAEGCGGIFAALVDPIVDRTLGLPSAAGHNTVIMSGTLDSAEAAGVVASESF